MTSLMLGLAEGVSSKQASISSSTSNGHSCGILHGIDMLPLKRLPAYANTMQRQVQVVPAPALQQETIHDLGRMPPAEKNWQDSNAGVLECTSMHVEHPAQRNPTCCLKSTAGQDKALT